MLHPFVSLTSHLCCYCGFCQDLSCVVLDVLPVSLLCILSYVPPVSLLLVSSMTLLYTPSVRILYAPSVTHLCVCVCVCPPVDHRPGCDVLPGTQRLHTTHLPSSFPQRVDPTPAVSMECLGQLGLGQRPVSSAVGGAASDQVGHRRDTDCLVPTLICLFHLDCFTCPLSDMIPPPHLVTPVLSPAHLFVTHA